MIDLYVHHTITACVQIWDWQCCWHELRQRTECYHKTFHSSTIFFRECLKLHWVWVGTLWNTGRFLRNFFSVSRFLNFIQTFSFGQNQTYTITKLSWYEVWWGLGRGRGTHVLAWSFCVTCAWVVNILLFISHMKLVAKSNCCKTAYKASFTCPDKVLRPVTAVSCVTIAETSRHPIEWMT